ncbi:uncharacterized protein BP5553_02901 [Venustampulla echinocandica]|uniref:AttH domain-containing protein n=1 Tax=Venustampulla echinocandica TaxID=2656787 RepID=A0A370TSR4_9HELO|nr:uncharacterized protein BP5553_02901 [Venustampulla echinocandica]RDL38561.1 hypothetical protein BP5553_02901 [Venustampulla echinocandica]
MLLKLLLPLALSSLSIASPMPGSNAYNYNCTIDRAVDGALVNGSVPIDTSPMTAWDGPKIAAFNNTAIEDWSFDAVSDDALAGITIAFSRGTIVGRPAAQRVYLFAAFPNGTTFSDITYFDFSTVKQCRGSTVGTWTNVTTGSTWTFNAATDLKSAKITIDSPRIKGVYTIKSKSPPFFPNGKGPGDIEGDVFFSPLLYWQETAAIGDVKATFTLDGSQLEFRGVGGRERNWMPIGWAQVSDGWHMSRGVAGPYIYVIWTLDSKIDGKKYDHFVLIKNKKIIFQSASSEMSDTEKYGVYNFPIEGLIKGPFTDNSTGQGADFINPVSRERWNFVMDNTQVVYSERTGKLTGYNGFVGKVSGGKVGGKRYEG